MNRILPDFIILVCIKYDHKKQLIMLVFNKSHTIKINYLLLYKLIVFHTDETKVNIVHRCD
ncbi:hypothetical protein DI09_572p10 [Mitosporidium daphniae]|uniref:Uncharacterized protein n=1 Tax=Mitosporidium daphniae TaxID=1485682 RepID=A0A098VP94_9MICR|nr:hypothetical protein DI09_572p10 [Mitosporidium daphniae]|eukprot:XP_013237216.1 uncharacterized protein DI09_572p10 [Mitosporidium daphniae]